MALPAGTGDVARAAMWCFADKFAFSQESTFI